MYISPFQRLLLGILSWLPLVMIVWSIASMFQQLSTVEGIVNSTEHSLRRPDQWLGASLLGIGMTVFYIYYMRQSEAFPRDRIGPWTVYLILGTFIALPSFWFHHVLRGPGDPR